MRSTPDDDLLFNADGTVKLPKLAGLAVSMAAADPRKKLSRQPTEQRAQAVADAIWGRCAARGYGVEVRPGPETFGVFLVPLRP